MHLPCSSFNLARPACERATGNLSCESKLSLSKTQESMACIGIEVRKNTWHILRESRVPLEFKPHPLAFNSSQRQVASCPGFNIWYFIESEKSCISSLCLSLFPRVTPKGGMGIASLCLSCSDSLAVCMPCCALIACYCTVCSTRRKEMEQAWLVNLPQDRIAIN